MEHGGRSSSSESVSGAPDDEPGGGRCVGCDSESVVGVGRMASTATGSGVLRPRSSLHNCMSSSSSSRAGVSVTFADDDQTVPDTKPQRSDGAWLSSTVDWVIGRAPYGLGAQAALAGAVVVVGYQLAVGDVGVSVHKACAVVVTVFSVSCSFCALALRLRRSWTNTAAYSLLTTCCGVELALGHALTSTVHHTSVPADSLVTVGVLTTAGLACILSPLDVVEGVLVVSLVGLTRYLSGTMLGDVPSSLRPVLIYGGGLAGMIAARYVESVLLQSVDSSTALAGRLSPSSVASRTPDMKRRRASSTSATNNYSSHGSARRITLPTLVHKSLVRT